MIDTEAQEFLFKIRYKKSFSQIRPDLYPIFFIHFLQDQLNTRNLILYVLESVRTDGLSR